MRNSFLIIILFIFSCNNENRKLDTINNKSNHVQINNYVTVKVKAKVLEDDKFDLYFSEFILEQYHPKDIVKTIVKGSDRFQEITFKLPEKIYPVKLRLDVGSRGHNSIMEVQEVTITTGDNVKTISATEFESIFKANKYLEKAEGHNTYLRKTINEIYDPFFVTINIEDMVKDLFKKDYEKKF